MESSTLVLVEMGWLLKFQAAKKRPTFIKGTVQRVADTKEVRKKGHNKGLCSPGIAAKRKAKEDE